MIYYPEGLPCFEHSGYSMRTVDPQLRSEMESGRQRVRRKFTDTPTYVQCSVLMRNDLQAQLFEAWWEQELVSGTKWFEAPVRTPLGEETRTARFSGIYDGPALVGAGMWRYTFTLELRKRPMLPPPWAGEAPEWLLYAGRFDRLMNDTWPEAINGNTP